VFLLPFPGFDERAMDSSHDTKVSESFNALLYEYYSFPLFCIFAINYYRICHHDQSVFLKHTHTHRVNKEKNTCIHNISKDHTFNKFDKFFSQFVKSLSF